MTKVETLIATCGRFGLYKRPNPESWTNLTYLVGIEIGKGKRVMLACQSSGSALTLFNLLCDSAIVE